jgi:hypothetical protein
MLDMLIKIIYFINLKKNTLLLRTNMMFFIFHGVKKKNISAIKHLTTRFHNFTDGHIPSVCD